MAKLGFGFTPIPHKVITSKAFKALNGNSAKLLIHLAYVYSENNPAITMDVRRAGDLAGINKDTASVRFKELQEKGFIAKVSESDFYNKKARGYRLTFRKYYKKQPTNDYLLWDEKKQASVIKTNTYLVCHLFR